MMLERNIIDREVVKTIPYFSFYHPQGEKGTVEYFGFIDKIINVSDKDVEQIKNKLNALKKDDWTLHKELIKEGHNPNEIAKIIRNDEIEKLQEISSQTNFDFDQKIEQSLYERSSFLYQENVALIDYAAFFGSIKCFKYLLMNGSDIENAGKYAIVSGNIEIIHLCEQNHS